MNSESVTGPRSISNVTGAPSPAREGTNIRPATGSDRALTSASLEVLQTLTLKVSLPPVEMEAGQVSTQIHKSDVTISLPSAETQAMQEFAHTRLRDVDLPKVTMKIATNDPATTHQVVHTPGSVRQESITQFLDVPAGKQPPGWSPAVASPLTRLPVSSERGRSINNVYTLVGAKDEQRKFTTLEFIRLNASHRPPPESYLSAEYREWHQAQFYPPDAKAKGEDRYVYSFVTRSSYENFIVNASYQGRKDGLYCLCKQDADELQALLRENAKALAKGEARPTNAQVIGTALGFDSTGFEGQEILMVKTKLSPENDVTISNGANSGANNLWVPGGRLPSGLLEGYCRFEPISNVTVKRVLAGNKEIASSRIAGELLMKRPGAWSLYKCKAEDLDRLAPEPEKDAYVLKVGVGSVIELDLNLEITADQAMEYMDDPSKADAHAANVFAAPEDHFHYARSVNRNAIWDNQKDDKVKQRREGREATPSGIFFYKAYSDERTSNITRPASTTITYT